jgi:hypothetical protein
MPSMSYNVEAWGTVEPFETITVGYYWPGEDKGAQFAQGKPEGATEDGSSNGALVSFNHQIDLDVDTQQISYSFELRNLTGQSQTFMLCGGGLV